MLVSDLRHYKEWIASHCCFNLGFLTRSHGWGHTLVFPPCDEKCQHLQVPYWKAEGPTGRDYHLRCCDGYSWYALDSKLIYDLARNLHRVTMALP